MKNNTVQIETSVPLSKDGYVFAVGGLCDEMLKLIDQRKPRGKGMRCIFNAPCRFKL